MSWFALALALAHFALLCHVWRGELRNRHSGFINLNGIGTIVLSLPSWLTLGTLLRRLGVPKPSLQDPRLAARSEYVTHALLTSALVYLLGWLLETAVRALFA